MCQKYSVSPTTMLLLLTKFGDIAFTISNNVVLADQLYIC